MRIAVVGACPFPVPQGSQVYLRDSALALAERGHKVHLVVYGHGIGKDDSGLALHRAPRVPGVRRTASGLSMAKPLLDALLVQTLRRVAKKFDIQMVAVHNYEALMVALAARVRPIIYHAHNAMADELPYHMSNPEWSATLGKWLDEKYPRRADRIVAPHEQLKEYLVACGCDADRIDVVPPVVSATILDRRPPTRRDCPVLYTGNLDSYQNLPLLYRAMESVVAEEPGTQLVLASTDNRPVDKEFLRQVIISNRSALERELGHDVIFACPRVSWSGYPVKILNAMAAGLPIVCCAGSAHPLTHQYDALIVPDDDVDAMRHSILRLMRDPELRAKLGTNAQKTFREQLSPQAGGETLEAIYTSCVQA